MKYFFIVDDSGNAIYYNHPGGSMIALPFAVAQNFVTENFNDSLSSIDCEDGTRLAFDKYESLTMLVVSDEGENEAFLRSQLNLARELLFLEYSPALLTNKQKIISGHFQQPQLIQRMTTIIDTMCFMCSQKQSFLVQSIEELLAHSTTSDVKDKAIDVLKSQMSQYPTMQHGLLFVGTKLLAEYRKPKSKHLSAKDILLLTLFYCSHFHPKVLRRIQALLEAQRLIDASSMGEGDSDEPPDIFGEENQRNKEAQLAQQFKLDEVREAFIAAGGLAVKSEGLFVEALQVILIYLGGLFGRPDGVMGDTSMAAVDLISLNSALAPSRKLATLDVLKTILTKAKEKQDNTASPKRGKVLYLPFEDMSTEELTHFWNKWPVVGVPRPSVSKISPSLTSADLASETPNFDNPNVCHSVKLYLDSTFPPDSITQLASQAVAPSMSSSIIGTITSPIAARTTPTVQIPDVSKSIDALELAIKMISEIVEAPTLKRNLSSNALGVAHPSSGIAAGRITMERIQPAEAPARLTRSFSDDDEEVVPKSPFASAAHRAKLISKLKSQYPPPSDRVYQKVYLSSNDYKPMCLYSAKLHDRITLIIVTSSPQESEPERRDLMKVETAINQNLVANYGSYLLSMENSYSMISYMHLLPGLCHFIFVDRSNNRILAPTIQPLMGNDSKHNTSLGKEKMMATLKHYIWQMVYEGYDALSRGCFDALKRAGDFQFSYKLWFHDSNGLKLTLGGEADDDKDDSIEHNAARDASPRRRRVFTSPHYSTPKDPISREFYKKLQKQLFPGQSHVRCYELFCIFVGNISLKLVEQYNSHLISTIMGKEQQEDRKGTR